MNNDIFLTQNQLYDDTALDVIKKRGTKAVITDYAIILGGYVSNLDDGSNLKYKIGSYFTGSYSESSVGIVYDDGKNYYTSLKRRDTGIRLVMPFKDKIPSNDGIILEKTDGVLEVEYGYYPQDSVSIKLEEELNNKFLNNNIKVTGNIHLFDSDGNITTTEVYELNGKKFVFVKANFYRNRNSYKLSNDKVYKNGSYVWIEVKPIKWLVDKKSNLMIMEKILFEGVSFEDANDFINKYLKNEMFNVENVQMVNITNDKDCNTLKDELNKIKNEIEYYKMRNEELRSYNEKLSKKNKQYKVTYEKLKFMK